VEDGLAPDAAAERVLMSSDRAAELLAAHPELAGIAMLGHVKVKLGGEVLELLDAAALGLATPPSSGREAHEPD